jgi:hypothetical protein
MYKTISVGYIINEEEDLIIDSYKTGSLIADEFVFVINYDKCPNTTEKLLELAKGDDKINVFINNTMNETENMKTLLSKCTKEYILLLKPCELLSDNIVLLRGVLENAEVEAYNIKTNYFLYDFTKCDNSGLNHLPLVRLLKNRSELTVIKDQVIGYVEPVILINEVFINNYIGVKSQLQFISAQLNNLNKEEKTRLKQVLITGQHPTYQVDFNIHNQIIKDKLEQL